MACWHAAGSAKQRTSKLYASFVIFAQLK